MAAEDDREQDSGGDTFVARLRGLTDALMAATRAPAEALESTTRSFRPGALRLPPMPGALSAQQLRTIVEDVRAKRAQVQAFRAQLEVFDQQLAAFEESLEPLVEWSRNWADLERSLTDLWPRGLGGTGGSGPGPGPR
ncbi:hypothetical protein H7X46_22285 [Pseudonocardia sp. C8]|uniref:hypothetical protein n=1 Tax=Pseudonocardia sp. C8 TaxID=2762759 RepID=UPI001642BCC3|nr:hypothetical protein [Pseudonocardia sp. C8]MBC3193793.1 hypothetical protein [Pseudonocardia sp. C8]